MTDISSDTILNISGSSARSAADHINDALCPMDFGAAGDGTTNDTTAVQNAINAAISGGKVLNITRNYAVTHVAINGANGLQIIGGGSLLGSSTGSYESVLTIKNSADIKTIGRFGVYGAYNTGYGAGLYIYTDNATQACVMDLDIVASGCPIGIKIGNPSYPSATVSEIKFRSGYTYGCPIACQTFGTQTVVNFIGYTLKSDTGANPAGWSSLTARIIDNNGSVVNVIGGELLMPAINTAAGFTMWPIADATFGNQFGSIFITGAVIECASQLAYIQNPSNITGLGATGTLSICNSSLFHSGNFAAFIVSVTNGASANHFGGEIRILHNRFKCSTARTQQNISVVGSPVTYDDAMSWGTNFKSVSTGHSGGTHHIATYT